MVLSDLILGWSQLVTGHADSLIISYLKMLHVRFSPECVAVNPVCDGTFLKLKDVTDANGSPKASELSFTNAGNNFGINSLWEKQDCYSNTW